jgi:hypothetical protein
MRKVLDRLKYLVINQLPKRNDPRIKNLHPQPNSWTCQRAHKGDPICPRAQSQRIPSSARPQSHAFRVREFPKLRYFSLVHPIENKRGFYLITKWGGKFLRGEIEMPVSVQTQDNHRIGKIRAAHSHQRLARQDTEFQSEFAHETPLEERQAQTAPLFT